MSFERERKETERKPRTYVERRHFFISLEWITVHASPTKVPGSRAKTPSYYFYGPETSAGITIISRGAQPGYSLTGKPLFFFSLYLSLSLFPSTLLLLLLLRLHLASRRTRVNALRTWVKHDRWFVKSEGYDYCCGFLEFLTILLIV